ncbi:MAG: amidohydrolase family protein [Promethearchaeota archaeon]
MKFSLNDPLAGLSFPKTNICDSHTHIWSADAFDELEKWGHQYGVKRFMGIAQPDIKKTLEQNGKGHDIIFAFYLPMGAFADHDANKLIEAVDEAHALEYSMVKMWFGPRFLDYFKPSNKIKFTISNPEFEPVFTRIEDYDIPIDVHVADPDIWYQTKYLDHNLYRTKDDAISEFNAVLERHPSLRTISVHFGSLPESLEQLETILKRFPNFHIDTASTKWIIRELGKYRKKSRDFFIRYKKRILFATDISAGWDDRPKDYIATRYWAQRLFWETNVQNVELPFSDADNPTPPTFINGLNLPQSVLDRFYWQNANEFFK